MKRPQARRTIGRMFAAVMMLASLPFGLEPTTAAAPKVARIVATSARSTVVRDSAQVDYSTLGLWLEAADQPFEIRVTKDYGEAPRIVRVDRSVSPAKRTTLDVPFDGFGRLASFFKFTVATTDGTPVSVVRGGLCPDSAAATRVNMSGPNAPTYPFDCTESIFTRGYVFGVDRGWAVPVIGQVDDEGVDPFDGLPDGKYKVTAEITPVWANALGISKADRSATITTTLTTSLSPRIAARRTMTSTDEVFTESSPVARPEPALARTAASIPASSLPDLVALPAYQAITMNLDNKDLLAFSATVANLGRGPLVVEGFRRPSKALMNAHQFFYVDGEPVASRSVGSMEYDPRQGHEHWHFLDFAKYELVDAQKDELQISGKESFCLAPTDAIDITGRGAEMQPLAVGLGGACGNIDSRWIRQELPAGWGDTYLQFLPGQSFDITNLANGVYYLKVTANPEGTLHESSARNNVAYRKITIGGVLGNRTVTLRPWKGIDTEFGLLSRGQLREALRRAGHDLTTTSAPAQSVDRVARNLSLEYICAIVGR